VDAVTALKETPMFFTLIAVLTGCTVLSVAGGGWWTNANNARNARGGPVPPATTRDYILVTLFMTLGVAAMLVGLWFMKK